MDPAALPKEAIEAVAETPRDNPASAFGANEWLVDEMYERYQADPDSVDKVWRDLFQDFTPGTDEGGESTNGGAHAEQAPTQQKPAPAPAQKPAVQRKDAQPARSSTATATAANATRPSARGPEAPAASGRSAASGPTSKEADEKLTERKLAEPEYVVLRGAPARTVTNMDASLTVPTATSVREVPVKLLWDNRIVINNHLARARGGKVSFTHIVGYALVQALKATPGMNVAYEEVDGKPNLVKPQHVNLGLAIDLAKPDGTRQLMVPSIKAAESMGFAEFWTAYEDVVKRARDGKLKVEDFQGTTITLTNPGTIGTTHSVARLMKGQGAIIGVGAMEYPAAYQGAAQETRSRLAVSKVMTLTSTYDHRVIQGAESGDFLRRIHRLLLGDDGFYDEIFQALRIPYQPIRWAEDIATTHDDDISKQARILELIHSYRVRGHMMADTDPLEYVQRSHPDLEIENHGLTMWDLDREFATGKFGQGSRFMKLRDILGILRDSYCRTVGIEYMHIQDPEQRRWIQERVERPHQKVPREEQLRILHKLNQAEAFETFLQTKFVGQKRFSLEGGETTVPLLDELCEEAAGAGLDEVCIGMAHRGRLNVLANIVGKSYGQIFREFEGNLDPRSVQGSGDVKYHLGSEGEFVSEHGDRIKVSVAANPSHLEAVDPVLEGIARAKQDLLNRHEEFPVLPVLVHGDAAFAGQGVVAETLNLSQLRGYRTGGTIHVVVNNQVGFTTSPASSRSSLYSTDVARMVQAPIFHVNGDDPEACLRVADLAFAYRQEFNKDVVIDLVCYRRRGHNEGDDPSYTQPLMYDLIERKRSVRKLYTEALIGRGDITVEEAEQAMRDYQQELERAFTEVREAKSTDESYATVPSYPDKVGHERTDTAISFETLKRISDAYTSVPEGFTVHPKVLPQLQRRAAAITDGPIDWATGEILAFGSLLMQKRPVRLAGQDSRRGTFVQRFATIIDRHNAQEWTPLRNLTEDQAQFFIYDSLLSEYAAMGFEYGYSVARPEALVLWEAQFGDFANGAQTIIDEFITAGEAKWGQRSGVVLLLPHGYEGQGPDHSSGRIERFLTSAAEDAFVVAQPSTPASYFHLLRRHSLTDEHHPMIVFTPKSMLRRKEATSQPADFTEGGFQPVLGDSVADPSKIERVLLCSGRITWDLLKERAAREGDSPRTAVVRVERLYPRPVEEINAELAKYPNLSEVRWVQDEPANMGPWPHMALHLTSELPVPFFRVSRPESTAPSVGSVSRHREEEKTLIEQAFS